MADEYWAEDAAADVEEPSVEELQLGQLEGKPIVGSYLNWVIKLLHKAYVTGIFYLYNIKIGTPSGSQTTLVVKNNAGSSNLLEISTAAIEPEVPIIVDPNGLGYSYQYNGENFRKSFHGGCGLELKTTSGITGGTTGTPPGTTPIVYTNSGNGIFILESSFDNYYDRTNDPEALSSPLYMLSDFYHYAKVEYASAVSGDFTTVQVGYYDDTGAATIVAQDRVNNSTAVSNVVTAGSLVAVQSHNFAFKSRSYFFRVIVEINSGAGLFGINTAHYEIINRRA